MNSYSILLLVFLSLLLLSQHTAALNILVIVPLPFRSHYVAYQRIFEGLALRGHAVTVMSYFPPKTVKNIAFVDMSKNRTAVKPITPTSEFESLDSRYVHMNSLYRLLVWESEIIEEDCEAFFTNENVNSLKNEKFDVIFVEQFISDCGLAYAAVTYDAPIIAITSHTLLPWTYSRFGIPFNFGTDAFYYSIAGQNPPLYNKIENFLMHTVLASGGHWYIQRNLYKVFNKYLPGIDINVEKLAKERIKMAFIYQHHSVTSTRLSSPQILEIAGAHIHKSKPVSKEIEDFLSDAKDGAIYVSFGSQLKFNRMSKEKLQKFLDTFRKIPQKVLWKLDNMTLPSGYDNVYAHSWFPQLDVLCHPKVLGFISHGGMLSLSEATHCGKPLIMIPFYGDQFSNAAAASENGIGIMMYFQNLEADNLVTAVRRMTSPPMQQNAKRVSKLWHDRPMDVIDSAIYWTEYVARHRDAPRPLPSTRSSWFQQSLIDVYVVLIGVLFVLCAFMYFIVKAVIILLEFYPITKIKTKGD